MTIHDSVDNGVDVEALLGAREAMTDAPAAAQFQWRAACEWLRGTHSRNTVTSVFGVGDEQAHRTTHTIETDHPEIFAAEDNGATPAELILMGLAGCLTGGVASVATSQKRSAVFDVVTNPTNVTVELR